MVTEPVPAWVPDEELLTRQNSEVRPTRIASEGWDVWVVL
jgi:hypothetical protein